MRIIYTISFLLIATILLANEQYNNANEAYKNGNYPEAIDGYLTLLETDEFADVQYNLGNAYYKLGDVSNAILYYEKALQHTPNDKDIKHNLSLANLQIIDKIEVQPEFFLLTWWKQLAKKRSSNQWTTYFLIVLWFSVLLFLSFIFTSFGLKRLQFFSGIGGILIAGLLLLLAISQHYYEANNNHAIIMASSVSVKSAPLNTGTDLFIIHEGLKVKILKQESEWLNIQLSDGKEGWLTKDMLARI